MKRVLHIAEPFATGVLSFLQDITKQQVEEYEVFIIYGLRSLTPPDVEELFDKRIKLIRLDSFDGAIKSLINPQSYIKINKLYKEINPDIVHLHSSVAGFIGRWVLPLNKVKTFYTPHGLSFSKQDGKGIKNTFFRMIESVSAKRNAKIIACSYAEYLQACELTKNVSYVNNGINVEKLNDYLPNEPLELKTKKISVCTSGRIEFVKNPDLFNKIAELLPDIDFVWIGEGDFKDRLTAPNIKVTGWISREDVLKILSDSQFFILCSRREGLSISLLEAMYLKKVCIISNVIGNKDVIEDNVNGFLFKDAQEFAFWIKKVISGEIDANAIVENAHRDVLDNYNTSLMAKKYDLIYNEN